MTIEEWADFLNQKEFTVDEINSAQDHANKWELCPVGGLNGIKRLDFTNSPLNSGLLDLGLQFAQKMDHLACNYQRTKNAEKYDVPFVVRTEKKDYLELINELKIIFDQIKAYNNPDQLQLF